MNGGIENVKMENLMMIKCTEVECSSWKMNESFLTMN